MSPATAPQAVDQLAGTYQLDLAHTRLGFAVRHLVTTVHGWFDTVEGELHVDPSDDTQCAATLTIDAASIRTNNADRDAHLRSTDFFDVERHPSITFTSTTVTAVGGDQYRVEGELTIKGITRPIQFELTNHGSCIDPYDQVRIGLAGSGSLNRSDFGLTWNLPLNTGAVVLSDHIDLELDVAAVKAG